MIERIISGGQTGADQAGWRAAKRFGIPTGGWMPKGFLTEDGRMSVFEERFGAEEHESYDYPPRTGLNAEWADVTIWFGANDTPGRRCTHKASLIAGRPWIVIESRLDPLPSMLAQRIAVEGYKIINIAGSRESKSPGIGERVERYLCEVFAELGYKETG